MNRININCDMGESFGRYRLGNDDKLLRWVTSANVACGLHAGDPLVMERTVRIAMEHKVEIGAHPGYPDLQGFGRREMGMSPDEVEACVLYQIGALAGFLRPFRVELVHVKPHGALYNQAAKDRALADAIARGTARFSRELILVGLAGSQLLAAGTETGLRVASEGFPDRSYNPDGSLRSRREAGAVLEAVEAVCSQALRLAREGAGQGGAGVPVDTLCIHGDNPNSAELAQAVRKTLEENQIGVDRLSEMFRL